MKPHDCLEMVWPYPRPGEKRRCRCGNVHEWFIMRGWVCVKIGSMASWKKATGD